MFATLDDFDWSSIEHAYGEAGDVPAMIRGMASSDADVRKKAYCDAHGNIWHQGTVYEASAVAVPYIIEIACAPQLADREQALHLLSDLACGNSYLDVHQHLSCLRLNSKPNFEEEKIKELKWVMDTTLAVEKGREQYIALLQDDDPKVSAAAAHLLSKCQEDAEDTVARLVAMCRSSDEEACRQAALLSAAKLAPDSAEVVECAKQALEDGAFRTQALGAYILQQGGSLPMTARNIGVAVRVMMNDEGETWDHAPLGDGFEQAMAQAFNDAVDEHGEDEEVARLILEAIKKGDTKTREVTPALCCLLKAAFGSGADAPRGVTGTQRDVIRFVDGACQRELDRAEMNTVAEELGVAELFDDVLRK